MAIVSSITESSIIQKDGRISIVERHTSHIGEEITKVYKVPDGSDIPALLAANAIKVDTGLKDAEESRFVDRAKRGRNVINNTANYITKRRALKAILKTFLTSDSDTARRMLNTVSNLSDAQINTDWSNKLVKVKRRVVNLLAIQADVDIDTVDVEGE